MLASVHLVFNQLLETFVSDCYVLDMVSILEHFFQKNAKRGLILVNKVLFFEELDRVSSHLSLPRSKANFCLAKAS